MGLVKIIIWRKILIINNKLIKVLLVKNVIIIIIRDKIRGFFLSINGYKKFIN